MAKNNDRTLKRQQKNLQKLAQDIQTGMDNIYRKTYYTDPSLNKNLSGLFDQINDSIDRITSSSIDSTGMPNISKLYSRILDSKSKSSSGDMLEQISEIFENTPFTEELYNSFTNNFYLKEMDIEIDTICRYMPKLMEALETRKDNVLSADHFSKDFLTVTSNQKSIDSVSFNNKIDQLKETYDLLTFIETVYDNTAKYGEEFIYKIPYKKALAKLLANKDNTITKARGTMEVTQEGAVFRINSSDKSTYTDKSFLVSESDLSTIKRNNSFESDRGIHIDLEFSSSNIIESVINSQKMINDKLQLISEWSMENEASTGNSDTLSFSGLDDLEPSAGSNDKSLDGLVDISKLEKSITVPGCVLKRLDHTQVSPIYIDDACIGYYYLELYKDDFYNELSMPTGFNSTVGDPMTVNSPGSTANMFSSFDDNKQDEMLSYISGQLSQYIDKNLINANQDLRKEIYMILKHNDIFNTANSASRMRITFIPPNEMIHVTFKKDPVTHRGISDLDRALIPAKIYCALYITNSIAFLTRGQDKRVYYVKQTVESNIAKTLLTTIQQIKQGNFGIREFRSINSVLGITGRFNDYVIPTNSSGDPPIQFEVMQGQSVELKNEMLDLLEEMAVNSTDVPLELIQARMSMDYATHYTMSSLKFLRKAYKRQGQFQKFLCMLFTDLYNIEYDDNLKLTVSLPPPVFLNITNSNQVIDNTTQFINNVVEMDLGDEDDDKLRKIYTRELMKSHLGTYIDWDRNSLILERARNMRALEKDTDEEV